MNATRLTGSILRSAALIALAALGVHQLRYLVAYGSGAHEQLAAQGHGYLVQAMPILVGFAVASLLAGLLRAAVRSEPGRPAGPEPVMRALLYAASIFTVFAVQEFAEGLLSARHAAGAAAVFGGGGWLALPLAAMLGTICAVLDGRLASLESLVAASARSFPRLRPPFRPCSAASRIATPLAALPLAFGIARRPPPLPS